MINPNFGSGGYERERMNRLNARMNRMFGAVKRYQNKLEKEELDPTTRRAKEAIAILGATIAESRILADEGCRIEKVSEAWVEAMHAKDSLYTCLVGSDPIWNLESIRKAHDHPLAIKLRRIYEIGESNIIKILDARK